MGAASARWVFAFSGRMKVVPVGVSKERSTGIVFSTIPRARVRKPSLSVGMLNALSVSVQDLSRFCHAAKALAPVMQRLLRDAVSVRHYRSAFGAGLLGDAHELFFGDAGLFHVVSAD
jgi:hypothetical protein